MPGATQQIVAVATAVKQQRDAAHRVIRAAYESMRQGDDDGAFCTLAVAVQAMNAAGDSTPPIQPTVELALVPIDVDNSTDVARLAPRAVRS